MTPFPTSADPPRQEAEAATGALPNAAVAVAAAPSSTAAAASRGAAAAQSSVPPAVADLDKIRLDPFKVMLEARVNLQNNDRYDKAVA